MRLDVCLLFCILTTLSLSVLSKDTNYSPTAKISFSNFSSRDLLSRDLLSSKEQHPSDFSSSMGVTIFGDLEPNDNVRVLVQLKSPPLSQYTSKMHSKANSQLSSVNTKIWSNYTLLNKKIIQQQESFIHRFRRSNKIQMIHYQFKSLTNTIVLTTKVKNIEQLKSDKNVLSITIDGTARALLDTSIPVIGGNSVWQINDQENNPVLGSGINVAVIDSGIDYTHPDLGGGFGQGYKVVGGYDFVNDDDDPMDDNGHGTHVSGIIGANGKIKGVAPGVNLFAYKVLDEKGRGFSSNVIAALERAVDPDQDPNTNDSVDIANLSLRVNSSAQSPLSEAANNAVDNGVVVVVAAGNSYDYYTIGSPGNAEKVITVAATDNADKMAAFSSKGPVKNASYIKPEISAPGVSIYSTVLHGSYEYYSGTSMAAPMIAGGVALLKQLYPDESAAQIKSRLLSSVVDLKQDVFTQGVGRVDLLAAVNQELLVQPTMVSFGKVDISQQKWRAEKSLTIRNLSDAEDRVILQVGKKLPEGVTVSIQSGDVNDGEVNYIAANSHLNVTLVLEVDNTVYPFPDRKLLILEGSILVIGQNESVRIPWTLNKSAELSIHWDSTPVSVSILSHNQYGEDFKVYWPKKNEVFVLTPGDYTVVSEFNHSGVTSIVFRENVLISDRLTLNISEAEATNEVNIESIIGADGELVEQRDLKNRASFVYFEKDGNGLQFNIWKDGTRRMKVSNYSSAFESTYNAFFQDQRYTKDDLHFYLPSFVSQGLSESVNIEFDARKASRIETYFNQQQALLESPRLKSEAGIIGRFDFGFELSDERYTEAFKVSAFANNQWDQFGGISLSFNLMGENGQWWSNLVRSQDIVFGEGFSYGKIGFDYQDYEYKLKFESASPALKNSNLYWSSPTYLSSVDDVKYLYLVDGLKDTQFNVYEQDLSYSASCDDQEVGAGYYLHFSQKIILQEDCQDITFTVNYLSEPFAQTVSSEVILAYKDIQGGRAYMPSIKQLYFEDSGIKSNLLYTNTSQIYLDIKFSDDSVASTDTVAVEFQLEGEAFWQPLNGIFEGSHYTGIFPVFEGKHYGSLRITLTDSYGNQMINTMRQSFLIGRGLSYLVDVDQDGIRNEIDSDDDNDGIPDSEDPFPLDPSDLVDTDGDGIVDQQDIDDDNDGVIDVDDVFPLDPSESADNDGDGIGDNADTDDDNDGVEDDLDEYPFDASRSKGPDQNESQNQTRQQSSYGGDVALESNGGGGTFDWLMLCLLGIFSTRFKKREIYRGKMS